MAVNRKSSKSYGLGSPFIDVFNAPVISNRYPTKKDRAPVGTIWIQQANLGGGEFAYATYALTKIHNNSSNWQIIGGDTIKKTADSPIATLDFNSNRSAATFTDFTTAAGASQVFIITNAWIVEGAQVLVTASNGGTNDAQMTVARVKTSDGSVAITLKNIGAAALNGDVVISCELMLNTI